MKRFALTKTVTYDLYAEIETDEVNDKYELFDSIQKEGESAWNIEWEQADGNDEVVTIEALPESNKKYKKTKNHVGKKMNYD